MAEAAEISSGSVQQNGQDPSSSDTFPAQAGEPIENFEYDDFSEDEENSVSIQRIKHDEIMFPVGRSKRLPGGLLPGNIVDFHLPGACSQEPHQVYPLTDQEIGILSSLKNKKLNHQDIADKDLLRFSGLHVMKGKTKISDIEWPHPLDVKKFSQKSAVMETNPKFYNGKRDSGCYTDTMSRAVSPEFLIQRMVFPERRANESRIEKDVSIESGVEKGVSIESGVEKGVSIESGVEKGVSISDVIKTETTSADPAGVDDLFKGKFCKIQETLLTVYSIHFFSQLNGIWGEHGHIP